jgi:hypothetical protein
MERVCLRTPACGASPAMRDANNSRRTSFDELDVNL